MPSTTLAARFSRAPTVSYTSAQPHERLDAHYDHSPGTATTSRSSKNTTTTTTTTNSNPSSLNTNDNLHAHRQNHNSSKLPAFRFADLRKDRISLPSLQQPTPLAPLLSQTTSDQHSAHVTGPPHHPNGLHHYSSFPDRPSASASASASASETKHTGAPTRTRSLKFDRASAAPPSAESLSRAKRPASDDVSAARSQLSTAAATPVRRRLTESAAVGPAQGHRELLLPKAIESRSDDKKSRPPVSHKLGQATDTAAAAASTSSARAAIPPIRSFRSSGSRKSVVLDMPARRAPDDSHNQGPGDAHQRDRALRALEGRRDDDSPRHAPSESGEMTATTDNDNTADIFMRIAREDPAPRASEKPAPAVEPTTISRIVRTHRRPLSAAVPSHETSPVTQTSRRLSDQRDSPRARQATDSQASHQLGESIFRASARDNLPQISTTEVSGRTQTSRTPLRPSPITPRQISFKDSFSESSSSYQRRRQSLTENNSLSSSRTTAYRNPSIVMAQSRTYHSSPLVPKSANVLADGGQHGAEALHAAEGTESSSSTAAASTVWDELDDLKSRIHRLERTGKMPTTPGGGASSDERPRTATTNATTVSASPKRSSGPGSMHAEGNHGAPAPREAQPLLISALSKTKDLVSPEVFSAIELAATDAVALSSMIGAVGQPGPISSGASTIGGYGGGVTDRQLRKKADSICRSLTELCLALAEPAIQKKQPPPPVAAPRDDSLLSPTTGGPGASGLTPARRPSAIADTMAKGSTSPRAPTSLEQKRKTMLASISLPTSRYTAAPSTPLESTAGRKSSLLLARIRRTTTDEHEEPQTGRRSSLLLRSRRTGTEEAEEPREGRKSSLVLRARKAASEEEDEPRARAPSRAITEVNSFRATSRDLAANTQAAHENPPPSSALPRRRMIPAAIATRFATSAAAGPAPTTPARKYLERSTLLERGTPQERASYLDRGPVNALAERLAEERAQQQQRQNSLGQTSALHRTGSLGRRTRETGIPSLRS